MKEIFAPMKFDTSSENYHERKEDNFMADNAKKFDWKAPVKPAVAWGAYGGTLALAIVLALIFWL